MTEPTPIIGADGVPFTGPKGDPGAPLDVPGPDHRADTGATTPNRAFWRTALQVGPAAALALLGVLPQLLQSIVDGFGQELPPSIYGVLVAITGALTLVAAITAKVMANQPAIEWFRKYAPFFAPNPK